MTGSSSFSPVMCAEPGLDDRHEQERPAASQRAGRQDCRGCQPCAASIDDHEPGSEGERLPVSSEGGGKDIGQPGEHHGTREAMNASVRVLTELLIAGATMSRIRYPIAHVLAMMRRCRTDWPSMPAAALLAMTNTVAIAKPASTNTAAIETPEGPV